MSEAHGHCSLPPPMAKIDGFLWKPHGTVQALAFLYFKDARNELKDDPESCSQTNSLQKNGLSFLNETSHL